MKTREKTHGENRKIKSWAGYGNRVHDTVMEVVARSVLPGAEADFAQTMLSVFVATLVCGMIGFYTFWFGGTMHLPFYLLLLYLIAGQPTRLR